MKTLKIIITGLFFLCFINTQVRAQDDVFDILKTGPEDASKFMNSYVAPVFKGFSYGFNCGWYNTAQAHKSLGFDLTLSTTLSFVPDADYFFTFRNADYTNLRLQTGTEASSPTMFGPDEPGPMIEIVDNYQGNELVVAAFSAPSGLGLEQEIGFSAIPTPTLQLGLGIIKNTDIKVRYAPDVLTDIDYSYWGIGIMHDITQWIPVVDKIPIDISIFGAYSKFSFSAPLDESDTGFPGENQEIKSGISGLTIEALVSKKISLLTLFGGVGYNTANSNFNLNGTYEITYPGAPVDYVPTWGSTLTNPVQISTKENSMKLTAGLRVNLAVVTLHGCYVFNGYNQVNFGLGVSVR